ncbi:MAG TPA: hypothetical protein PKA41_11050 [Verrucomicrobiota bacterium]|nr:hypothetical protein [Verrucomicrobiota bacterium]
MRVLQIVPSLPPSVSGVGDYASVLGRAMEGKCQIESVFAVANPQREFVSKTTDSPVLALRHSPEAVAQAAGEFDRVLVHYVGYGYEKRGCPFWLVRGLKAWSKSPPVRGLSSGKRLVTMFHELFAFGPPWRSSFWTHPAQRWLCRKLALLSNGCVTNLAHSRDALQRLRRQEDVTQLPVFSNVGELATLPVSANRARRLILFGSESWRRLAVTRDLPALNAACDILRISEVLDIGPGTVGQSKVSAGWRVMGALPASEVSRWMTDATAGFLSYPSHCLGKSSIFAAYAAHGLLPVLPARCLMENCDGLRPGEQFVTSNQLGTGTVSMTERVQRNIFDWYQNHNVAVQAECFGRLLAGGSD